MVGNRNCFFWKQEQRKVFLLIQGRREPNKPQFGALRTFRKKRSDRGQKQQRFAAVKKVDCSFVTWGNADYGGN